MASKRRNPYECGTGPSMFAPALEADARKEEVKAPREEHAGIAESLARIESGEGIVRRSFAGAARKTLQVDEGLHLRVTVFAARHGLNANEIYALAFDELERALGSVGA